MSAVDDFMTAEECLRRVQDDEDEEKKKLEEMKAGEPDEKAGEPEADGV